MKIELNPTVVIDIPDEFKDLIDVKKFQRYSQYDMDQNPSKFEPQLLEHSMTRFLVYCLSSAISDSLGELNETHITWIDIAKVLGEKGPVQIRWSDEV